jgi:hypothetical protein
MSNQGRGIVVKWELVHKSKTIYPVTNGRPGEKEDLLSVLRTKTTAESGSLQKS